MATQLFFLNTPASTHLGTNNTTLRTGAGTGWRPWALGLSRGSGVDATPQVGDVGLIGPINGAEFVATNLLEWFSEPLAADVTISGTITFNLWAAETNMNMNAAINVLIERVEASTNALTQIIKTARTVELALTTSAVNNFTGTPTSTAMSRGDRLRVRVFVDDSTSSIAGSGVANFSLNGTTAASDGDSYVSFTEDFSFEGVASQTSSAGSAAIGQSGVGQQQVGQPFVAQGNLTEVRATLAKTGAPTDNLIIEVQGDSSGSPSGVVAGTVTTVSGASLTTTKTEYTYSCSIALSPSSTYWLVYRRDGSLGNTNLYSSGSSAGPASGWTGYSAYNGSAWGGLSSATTVRLAFAAGGSTLYLTNAQSGMTAAPALISSFTGSDESPLSEGGNWAIVDSAGAAMRRVSNTAGAASAPGRSYWTPADFGPDLEAYVTVPTASSAIYLLIRLQGAGGSATWDGYQIQGSTTGFAIDRVTNAVQTTIASTTGVTVASTDKVGVRAEGSTIQVWKQTSGTGDWNLVLTAVDTTYASAGKIGVGCIDTTARLDDFYAATDSSLFTQKAWTSRGSGVVSYLSDTDTGWTAPLLTNEWFTPRLNAFTLTGMAQANIRALESNASANASLRCEIARVESDGSSPTVWSSWCCAPTGTDNGELTTSEVARTLNLSGDDLAITDGQRLRIRLYNEDTSNAAMANAFNVQRFYNGTSAAASGDSYITLPQTVTEFGGGTTYTKAGYGRESA